MAKEYLNNKIITTKLIESLKPKNFKSEVISLKSNFNPQPKDSVSTFKTLNLKFLSTKFNNLTWENLTVNLII